MAYKQEMLEYTKELLEYNLEKLENNLDSLANKWAMPANIADWSENNSVMLVNNLGKLVCIVETRAANKTDSKMNLNN